MNRLDYLDKIDEIFAKDKNSKNIMVEQVNNFFDCPIYFVIKHKYNVGNDVFLKKGTLLHGTYKNIDGLKRICKEGLITGDFSTGRLSKYKYTVGVWNLKKDYYLKDYINFYSGGTIMYCGVYFKGIDTKLDKTVVIPYNDMPNINDIANSIDSHMWVLEQTKEARFMPSLVQNRVQVGIIFDGNNKYVRKLLKGDILNHHSISDEDVKDFVNSDYYVKFIKDRKNKDDFFTDRESAVLFGIPSVFIEGILVGRKYEKDNKILSEIKKLFPNSYICNLDGKVIIK